MLLEPIDVVGDTTGRIWARIHRQEAVWSPVEALSTRIVQTDLHDRACSGSSLTNPLPCYRCHRIRAPAVADFVYLTKSSPLQLSAPCHLERAAVEKLWLQKQPPKWSGLTKESLANEAHRTYVSYVCPSLCLRVNE